MKLLCLLLLLTVIHRTRCQQSQACEAVQVVQEWTKVGTSHTLFCDDSPSWWIVSDLCGQPPSDATELSECRGTGMCVVTSEMYSDLESCIVCCTDSAASFNLGDVQSCTRINVCPEVEVFAPATARTGSSVPLLTFVTTKPPPPLDGISVSIQDRMPEDSDVVPSEALYTTPSTSNRYAFVHTLHLPLRTSVERSSVLINVDTSGVPHDDSRCSHMDTRLVNIDLVQGNSTSTVVTPVTGEVGTEDPSTLDVKSLLIGIAVGMVGMILLAVLVGGVVCCARASSRKKSNSLPHGVGTSRPLLTANGTPATTPSYEAQRSLGQSSTNTPASTPTEMQDLQLASPQGQGAESTQGQGAESNTYQEILHVRQHLAPPAVVTTMASHTSVQSTALFSQRVVPSQSLTVGAGAPAPPPPPPPSVYVPNPPKNRQLSGPFLPPSHAQPSGYHTQGEAVDLTKKYEHKIGNGREGIMV